MCQKGEKLVEITKITHAKSYITHYTIICKSLRPLESWVYILLFWACLSICELIITLCGYDNDPLIREVLWAVIMAKFRTASYCMTFDISNKKGQKNCLYQAQRAQTVTQHHGS